VRYFIGFLGEQDRSASLEPWAGYNEKVTVKGGKSPAD
jgi:hypothetical protein